MVCWTPKTLAKLYIIYKGGHDPRIKALGKEEDGPRPRHNRYRHGHLQCFPLLFSLCQHPQVTWVSYTYLMESVIFIFFRQQSAI